MKERFPPPLSTWHLAVLCHPVSQRGDLGLPRLTKLQQDPELESTLVISEEDLDQDPELESTQVISEDDIDHLELLDLDQDREFALNTSEVDIDHRGFLDLGPDHPNPVHLNLLTIQGVQGDLSQGLHKGDCPKLPQSRV